MLRSIQFQLDTVHTTILAMTLSSLFLFSSILSTNGYTTRSHTFIYATCSQEKYQPNTPFEANLNSLLSSFLSSSSQASYNNFAIGNGTSNSNPLLEGSIYGLYQCRGDLSPIDCSKCVQSCVNQIGLVCPYAIGASLQLEGCYLRYEPFDFIGKIDTSLRYKKCNNKKDVTNDVEFLRHRDHVLGDLEGANSNSNNGFRVRNSGIVEGYAECLEDLDEEDCNSCIGEAVVKAKSLCGSAASSGGVFLAQCYARYWESGYYDDESDSSSNEDQVGKSIAIIVGVIVGLAIVVVLLSICRSGMGNHR